MSATTDDRVAVALEHYDQCRILRADALRVAGEDSGEYMRADGAWRIARVLLDAALNARATGTVPPAKTRERQEAP